jgi:hypothetical protein
VKLKLRIAEWEKRRKARFDIKSTKKIQKKRAKPKRRKDTFKPPDSWHFQLAADR